MNVIINSDKLDSLAMGVYRVTGEEPPLTLDEMTEALQSAEIGGGGITPTGNINITQAGQTDVTNYATATVAQGDIYVSANSGYYTENGVRKWFYQPSAYVEIGDDCGTPGYIPNSYVKQDTKHVFNAIPSNTTITPSTSPQTIGGTNYMMAGPVTVAAMPTGTEGTPTATKGTVSNHSVSITPSVTNTAGYISGGTKTGTAVTVQASELVSGTLTVDSSGTKDVTNYATATVPSGSLVGTIVASTTPTITVSDDGLVDVVAEDFGSEPVVYQSGWIDNNSTLGVYKIASAQQQLPTQAAVTITPSTTAQTAVAKGKWTTGAVTVAAMPSGTAGTPTATKGTVSNHSISITPSVTNTTGYITGSTKTGTPVTVSASELVSGSETKTENGTYDVTNLASLVVNVQGGGSSGTQIGVISATTPSSSSILTFTGLLGEPTSFIILLDSTMSSGTEGLVSLTWDGRQGVSFPIVMRQGLSSSGITFAESDGGIYSSYNQGTFEISNSAGPFYNAPYILIYSYGGTNYNTKQVQVGSGATSITFTGLEDEPTAWYLTFRSNFSTSNGYQRVIAVVNNGQDISGLSLDSSAHPLTSWTASYNNGSLTVTSAGTNNGGYFHQPGYYQLTYVVGGTAEPVEIEVEPLSVTENGTYTASDGKAYSPVTVNVASGGANIDTKTVTASNYPVSISFSSMKGTPKAFFLRSTSQISSSGNTAYYYITDLVYDGNANNYCNGNCFRIGSTRQVSPITTTASGGVVTGYTWSYSGTTLTITSSAASRSASPGSFNNGYQLVYVY